MRKIWREVLLGIGILGLFVVAVGVGYGWRQYRQWLKLPAGRSYLSPLSSEINASSDNVWRYLQAEVLGRGVARVLADPAGCGEWQVRAKGWLAYDLTNNQLLCGYRVNEARPIASITKLMTAVVGLESAGGASQEVRVGPDAASVGEASMHLTEGEVLTVKELVYGMLLRSGNDAAEALARGVGQRRSVFVQLMNQKAREVGMVNTSFVNPTGLDEDDGRANAASPMDLVALVKYILRQHPTIAGICGTKEMVLPATEGHKRYDLVNQLGLAATYPGMKGLKPGNSDLAGLTLVGLAENEGREVVAVLLDSPSPREDVRRLYERAYGR